MAVAIRQFTDSLTKSGLMTAAEVTAILDDLPPENRPKDGAELARLLVRREHLTKFQAQALYQGKTRGLVLGNYVILDKLGRGGMGQVYRARHRRMNRVVALKVLPASATKTVGAVERFHREVEAAARLSHPNVVTAHDADDAHGIHFLVMEYIEGQDLSAVVYRHGPLPMGRALDYVIQAAKGLEYAHSRNVIHRDIKPSNLVRDSQETVKILDMGLAKINELVRPTDCPAEQSLTRTGTAMGTIDYMPPEQAENVKAADERADIYSLGCTLFFLLTGHPVYQRDTEVAKLLAHRDAPIPSLRTERDDASATLDEIFQTMVAKNLADRYASTTEVVEALEACRKAMHDELEPTVVFRGKALVAPPVQETRSKEVEETRADEVLPLDLHAPVKSPIEGFLRTHAAGKRGQMIVGSVVAGAAFLAMLVLGTLLVFSGRKDHVQPLDDQPSFAIAPFSETEAKRHQRAWADYLGVSVTLENSIDMKLVLISPGEFRMGSPEGEKGRSDDEHPHPVSITKPFYLGVYEVTQAEYERVTGQNPSQFSLGGGGEERAPELDESRFPVERVSWDDAAEFCRKLSSLPEEQAAGRVYRLPTEAEWEYACRSGTTTPFHFGTQLNGKDAKCDGNHPYGTESKGPYVPRPTTIGSCRPNAFGLYDMHGNVWEWCQDWYDHEYYKLSPVDDPPGPSRGSSRVFRGGSWSISAAYCRTAFRFWLRPSLRDDDLGFRVAAVPTSK